MSRAELKSLAKKQIKGNVLILFVIGLIAGADHFLGGFCSSFVQSSMMSNFNAGFNAGFNAVTAGSKSATLSPGMFMPLVWYMAVFIIISLVIMSPLRISHNYAYLEAAKDQKPGFSMLGYGYKNCWVDSILLNLLTLVFTFLWSLLFFIPGIIKTYSYSMSTYIMAENPNVGALEAITKSKEMMKGHKFELFILDLSFIFWYLLIPITFGFASIYIAPYVNATRTNFYLKLKEAKAE